MGNGVLLYNQQYLFGRCDNSTIISGLNNAPGLTHGGGGIDSDVATRIGFKDIESKTRVAGTNKGRVQGICCGITAGWMVAFLGGNTGATDHSEFNSFFLGPLRFQGAYVKDFKPNSGSIAHLLDGFGLSNSNRGNTFVQMSPDNIASTIPEREEGWAGYIGAYEHAIGIGYKNGRYFIMEPNGGLFDYSSKGKFVDDLRAFLNARRNKKAPNTSAEMKAYFYWV